LVVAIETALEDGRFEVRGGASAGCAVNAGCPLSPFLALSPSGFSQEAAHLRDELRKMRKVKLHSHSDGLGL